jgi:hypothetical protein
MRIDSVANFEAIVAEIRDMLASRVGQEWPEAVLNIKVPGGPIEHW